MEYTEPDNDYYESEAIDPNQEACCTNETGHKWDDNDYCIYCGADGRA